jgi:hypothetical protein
LRRGAARRGHRPHLVENNLKEGFGMLGWVVRLVMAAAGVVAGWFVARDAANFGVVQMVVSLLLITILVAAAAFWPSLVAWFRSRGERNGREGR